MSAADRVSVHSLAGVISIEQRGRVLVSYLHLTASQALVIAPLIVKAAEEIMRHPLYESLREDQR
jgi:hypothetical protein